MANQTVWASPPTDHDGWEIAVDPTNEFSIVKPAINTFEHVIYPFPQDNTRYHDGWSRDSNQYIDRQPRSSQYQEQSAAESCIGRESGLAAMENESLYTNFEFPITPQFSEIHAGEARISSMLCQPPTGGGLVDALEHGIVEIESGFVCLECSLRFRNKSALNSHARQALHSPWVCKCGKTFSRLDDLKRHANSYKRTTKHPCPYCSKFRDERAFPRKDHLAQHIRNYHHIEDDSADGPPELYCCHYKDCSYHTANRQFARRGPTLNSRSKLTKHLREAHNESPFPCPETGCHRVGSQGYFRKKDLIQHQKNQHPLSYSSEHYEY